MIEIWFEDECVYLVELHALQMICSPFFGSIFFYMVGLQHFGKEGSGIPSESSALCLNIKIVHVYQYLSKYLDCVCIFKVYDYSAVLL